VKLKKAAVVTAATASLVLAGSPAFAASSADVASYDTTVTSEVGAAGPTFGDAFLVFIEGGGALGYGAAALIAGAYTGIALTPALIAHAFSN